MPFDEFFYKFMEEKFKLRKLVKKHCEETILSILEYSSIIKIDLDVDHRIDLIRRFLGIGEDRLSKFVFEIYLVLVKCKELFTKPFLYLFTSSSVMIMHNIQ